MASCQAVFSKLTQIGLYTKRVCLYRLGGLRAGAPKGQSDQQLVRVQRTFPRGIEIAYLWRPTIPQSGRRATIFSGCSVLEGSTEHLMLRAMICKIPRSLSLRP